MLLRWVYVCSLLFISFYFVLSSIAFSPPPTQPNQLLWKLIGSIKYKIQRFFSQSSLSWDVITTWHVDLLTETSFFLRFLDRVFFFFPTPWELFPLFKCNYSQDFFLCHLKKISFITHLPWVITPDIVYSVVTLSFYLQPNFLPDESRGPTDM